MFRRMHDSEIHFGEALKNIIKTLIHTFFPFFKVWSWASFNCLFTFHLYCNNSAQLYDEQ